MDRAKEQQVKQLVHNFFAEECDLDPGEISDGDLIIEDLDGDSLMLLALLESACKTFGITVELKSVGRHLMKRPASTVGDIIGLTLALVEHGDKILEVEL